jgi:hypothetical protein
MASPHRLPPDTADDVRALLATLRVALDRADALLERIANDDPGGTLYSRPLSEPTGEPLANGIEGHAPTGRTTRGGVR